MESSDQNNKAKGPGGLEKGRLPTEQDEKDKMRLPTVVPENDNGSPGAPFRGTANKQNKETAN